MPYSASALRDGSLAITESDITQMQRQTEERIRREQHEKITARIRKVVFCVCDVDSIDSLSISDRKLYNQLVDKVPIAVNDQLEKLRAKWVKSKSQMTREHRMKFSQIDKAKCYINQIQAASLDCVFVAMIDFIEQIVDKSQIAQQNRRNHLLNLILQLLELKFSSHRAHGGNKFVICHRAPAKALKFKERLEEILGEAIHSSTPKVAEQFSSAINGTRKSRKRGRDENDVCDDDRRGTKKHVQTHPVNGTASTHDVFLPESIQESLPFADSAPNNWVGNLLRQYQCKVDDLTAELKKVRQEKSLMEARLNTLEQKNKKLTLPPQPRLNFNVTSAPASNYNEHPVMWQSATYPPFGLDNSNYVFQPDFFTANLVPPAIPEPFEFSVSPKEVSTDTCDSFSGGIKLDDYSYPCAPQQEYNVWG